MLCKSEVASLTRSSGQGTDHSLTGLCFEPKALLIWANNGATFSGYGPNGGEASIQIGWGTSSSSEFSQRTRHDAPAVLYATEDSGAIGDTTLGFSLVSLDPDGFTLSLPFNGTYTFFYMALGGTNLDVYMNSFTPAASGSSSAVTGVGFQPDFLIGLHMDDAADTFPHSNYSFAMASSSTDQATVAGSQRRTTGKTHTLLNGKFVSPKVSGGSTGSDFITHVSSFDSDGFTVHTDSATTISGNIAYLAIKDPDSVFKVGVDTAKTSTGTKSTGSLGFQPAAGLFVPSFKTTDNDTTYAGFPVFGLGSADGIVNQGISTMWSTSGGTGGSEQDGYQSTTDILDVSQVSSGATSHTPLARASLDSWDSGGFTLDWTVADGNAYYFIYAVFATDRPDPCVFPTTFVPQIYRRLEAG